MTHRHSTAGRVLCRRWLPALLLGLLLVGATLLAGCTEDQRKSIKHAKSGLVGLKRTITLYDCSGKPIKEWSGRFKVELQGGTASFITDDDREVKISGTYVIEEVE